MATLELLAEKLGKQLWVKGDLKRIYLNDAGYNTKKMSTKTFIWQDEEGEFKVSCKIDCPSQAYQWIKSQEEEVKESVLNQIEEALATEVFLIKDNKVAKYEGYKGTLNSADVYYSKEKAEKAANESCISDWTIEEKNRIEFEVEVERLDEIDRQQREAEKADLPVEPIKIKESTSIKNTATPTYGVDSKVKHKLFGIGTVLSESDDKIEISFEVGIKSLLKKFAPLEKL